MRGGRSMAPREDMEMDEQQQQQQQQQQQPQQEQALQRDRVRALVDSLSPRTAHQYRSHCRRYVEWLVDRGLVERDQQQGDDLVHYRSLPLSTALVHWHIIDTDPALPSLRKILSSLKFLGKLCAVHGASETALDEKWLEQLTRLREEERGEAETHQLADTVAKVSANVWAPHSQLPDKYFRNGLERLRFLVDFQWRAYARLGYAERAQIRLADLRASSWGVTFDVETPSNLGQYVAAAPRGLVRQHQPVALLPQRDAFVCPLVSLAAYLLLRFRDGGFPELGGDGSADADADADADAEAEAAASWQELPLVRGKSVGDYPREETLAHYYAAVFRYCRLAYKRREWFGKARVEYPRWPVSEWEDFFGAARFARPAGEAREAAFPHRVARDYAERLNMYGGAQSPGAAAALPEERPEERPELLVQLFPEVEEYRRRHRGDGGGAGLSEAAERFLTVLETLRARLLRALPALYRAFPDHDLFQREPLNRADFKTYYADAGAAEAGHVKVEGLLEGFPPVAAAAAAAAATAAPAAGTVGGTENGATDTTFQLVQYHTLSNFEILLSLLSEIFDKLDMKKSSREYAIHQLALVHDTLKNRIRASKRGDAALAAHAAEPESESDPDHDDGDPEDDLQQMVEELITRHVKALETRMEGMVEARLAKMETRMQLLESRLGQKRPADDEHSSVFALDPALDSVEDVVLEWFTPNPLMGGQCVHSMNRLDKSWRVGCEDLYRQRKAIVEFYIYLVNSRGMDRYKAVDACERLRGSGDLQALAARLRDWKKENDSFDGLVA